MNLRSLLLVLVGTAVGALAHGEGPDVRTLMSAEEFRAAGLDKLSAAELEALNAWIVKYTARDAPEVRRMNEVVQAEAAKADAEGIRTRVIGEFRGWTGDTVFRLENGQVWKQRLKGRWFYRAESPEVVLRKNTIGFWEMRVVEADRAVGVTRLK